jgi:hypothetical protein
MIQTVFTEARYEDNPVPTVKVVCRQMPNAKIVEVNRRQVSIIRDMIGDDNNFKAAFSKLSSYIFSEGIIFYRNSRHMLKDSATREMTDAYTAFGSSHLQSLLLYGLGAWSMADDTTYGKLPCSYPIEDCTIGFAVDSNAKHHYYVIYQGRIRNDIRVNTIGEGVDSRGFIRTALSSLIDIKCMANFTTNAFILGSVKRINPPLGVQEREPVVQAPTSQTNAQLLAQVISDDFVANNRRDEFVVNEVYRQPGVGNEYLAQRQSMSVVDSLLANSSNIAQTFVPQNKFVSLNRIGEQTVFQVDKKAQLTKLPTPSTIENFSFLQTRMETEIGKAIGLPRELWTTAETRYRPDFESLRESANHTIQYFSVILERLFAEASLAAYGTIEEEKWVGPGTMIPISEMESVVYDTEEKVEEVTPPLRSLVLSSEDPPRLLSGLSEFKYAVEHKFEEVRVTLTRVVVEMAAKRGKKRKKEEPSVLDTNPILMAEDFMRDLKIKIRLVSRYRYQQEERKEMIETFGLKGVMQWMTDPSDPAAKRSVKQADGQKIDTVDSLFVPCTRQAADTKATVIINVNEPKEKEEKEEGEGASSSHRAHSAQRIEGGEIDSQS